MSEVSGADARIIALNDAMNQVDDASRDWEHPCTLELRSALRKLQVIKRSLIQHLDHDRQRPISYPNTGVLKTKA